MSSVTKEQYRSARAHLETARAAYQRAKEEQIHAPSERMAALRLEIQGYWNLISQCRVLIATYNRQNECPEAYAREERTRKSLFSTRCNSAPKRR